MAHSETASSKGSNPSTRFQNPTRGDRGFWAWRAVTREVVSGTAMSTRSVSSCRSRMDRLGIRPLSSMRRDRTLVVIVPRQLSRTQVIAYRMRAQHLTSRLPFSVDSLRAAAWAGWKDSMPRAALLSLHARVDSVGTDSLDDPSLVQVWGPGFHAYVVSEVDVGVFTVGRMPDQGRQRDTALELAERLDSLLGDEPMTYRDAGKALGVHHNALRYASLTGTIELQWAGSGKPTISKRPPPDIDPVDARHELARRFLRVLGPATASDLGAWAGIKPVRAARIFEELGDELQSVITPFGEAHVLSAAESDFSEAGSREVRLLPSGDVYCLLWRSQREMLVPDPTRRQELWTSRVWPGAVMSGGEIVGTWRRAAGKLTVTVWRKLSTEDRSAVESEALTLPLEEQPLDVVWLQS